MIWLEAAVAFALLMIVFSTMVSAILEVIHRIFGLRHRGLKKMLENLFNRIIWTRYSKKLTRMAAAKGINIDPDKIREKIREDFVALLSSNPGSLGVDFEETKQWKIFTTSWWVGGNKRDSISTEEFIERFAGSEFGQCLVEEAKASEVELKERVKEISQNFDSFATGAADYFSRRSRFWTLLISIVFAFAINFDAIKVFQTFLVNQKLRDGLIAKSVDIQKAYEVQQKSLEAVKKAYQEKEASEKTTKTEGTTGGTNVDTTTAGKASEDTTAEQDKSVKSPVAKANIEDELEKIKQGTEKIQENISRLTSEGIPIGWKQYSNCKVEKTEDKKDENGKPKDKQGKKVKKDKQDKQTCFFPKTFSGVDYFKWVLSTLLGGVTNRVGRSILV